MRLRLLEVDEVAWLFLRTLAPGVSVCVPDAFALRSHVGVGSLHAERRDEDVHHDDDEDEGRGDVFQNVQLVVFAFVVQIPFD